jgi:acetylornithine deacetylase
MEECGGHLSPMHLMEKDHFPVAVVLCGEHTDLYPVNRQRGMLHLHVCIQGKGAHAAAPEGSSSAMTGIARVALALERLNAELPADDTHGKALVSLNRVHVSPNVINAIPDRCEGVVDIRHPVSVSREAIIGLAQKTVHDAVAEQAGLQCSAEIQKRPVRSYTGLEELSDGGMLPFYTPEDNPLVMGLKASIEEATSTRPSTRLWTISSEAGYFSTVAGLPVVCYGPGEDRFTHNQSEHVKVEDVVTAAKVYACMIYRLCCCDPILSSAAGRA